MNEAMAHWGLSRQKQTVGLTSNGVKTLPTEGPKADMNEQMDCRKGCKAIFILQWRLRYVIPQKTEFNLHYS
jgi:hypothetical protein